MHGGGLESELAHSTEKISLLQRLRETSGEEVANVVGLNPPISTNGDDRCRGVLVIGAFDVSSSTFTIEDWHLKVHENTIKLDITHRNTDSFRPVRNHHTSTTKPYEQSFNDFRRDGIIFGQ